MQKEMKILAPMRIKRKEFWPGLGILSGFIAGTALIGHGYGVAESKY